MPAKVFYHVDFYNGDWRCDKFSDFGKLTTGEALRLAEFVTTVEDGDVLPGKNKESWLRDDGTEISERIGYRTNKLWHYHAGPYSQAIDPIRSDLIRNRNVDGHRSGPVVHYKWLDPSVKSELLILAFSPQHTPFPVPRNNPNHLDQRGGILLNKASKIVEAIPSTEDTD
ncbi:hypothetical protein AB4307_03210 [Vibrio sp. 10N.261.52.C2]|uniref:hypothetical protein n=1 Tax=unclassified Vibrio TaxID=2614977 RepID=UPI00352F89BA